jgi:hypothetical protein
VSTATASSTDVVVNVYFGSARNRTEMKFGEHGEWTLMQRTVREDPYLQKVVPKGHPLSRVQHIWTAPLPERPPSGPHLIRVRTTDMFGQIYRAARVIRVE